MAFRSALVGAHTPAMERMEPVEVAVQGDDGTRREVTLRLRDGDVTVDDLAAALGCRGALVFIDGREVAGAAALVASGLRRGSVVTRRAGAREAATGLRWTGGVDAGRTSPLAAGTSGDRACPRRPPPLP